MLFCTAGHCFKKHPSDNEKENWCRIIKASQTSVGTRLGNEEVPLAMTLPTDMYRTYLFGMYSIHVYVLFYVFYAYVIEIVFCTLASLILIMFKSSYEAKPIGNRSLPCYYARALKLERI